MYALLNRIRLCASDAVLMEAERTLHFITEQYFSPNLSVEEVRNLIRSRDQDPLKAFGEACRRELKGDAHGCLVALSFRGKEVGHRFFRTLAELLRCRTKFSFARYDSNRDALGLRRKTQKFYPIAKRITERI